MIGYREPLLFRLIPWFIAFVWLAIVVGAIGVFYLLANDLPAVLAWVQQHGLQALWYGVKG